MTEIKEYFKNIEGRERPDLAGVNATCKFVIDGVGTWTLDIADSKAKAYPGDRDADCTIAVSAEHFQRLLDGTLNAQMAFMSGQLLVEGDIGLAMKLSAIL